MKNMALLIDANIILDSLLEREPFVKQADKIIEYCEFGLARGYIACHSLTNIFYILRKKYSIQERKDIIWALCHMFEIVKIDVNKVFSALSKENFIDLEDSLQIECAIAVNANYIITRDPKGFANSPIQALSPMEFLEL